MIVVDSSVWISHLRNIDTVSVQKLRTIDEPQEILVGDIILLELLQGARNEQHANAIEQNLRQFELRTMFGERLAIQAARNYRLLREQDITVRKTIDMIIGTFCIEEGHHLLHEDRDFDPMVQHLGLQVLG
jgi:predicted nucleic acid-binding protein